MPARPVPAGDTDYDTGSSNYAQVRRADPRIAKLIHDALGDARTVLNVGAGAGSHEPTDRSVTAVEPSARMRAQRPPGRPAIDATAESLPFTDGSFDAAMALVTVHQWPDAERGLRELRRVASGPVVVLTFEGAALQRLWLHDYVPELIAAEAPRYPTLDRIAAVLGDERVSVTEVPIPLDCTDGFTEAFYGRPEALLDPAVRAAQSSWAFADPSAIARGLARLASDLADGTWDARYGALRTQPTFVGALRLVVAAPATEETAP